MRTCIAGAIATAAVAAFCTTARADFVGGTYTNGASMPTAWDSVGGAMPFWTSVTNANPSEALRGGAASQIPPGNQVDATAQWYPLGETIFTSSQRYRLTAISTLLAGSPAGELKMNLFDITGAISSNNGSITNGSGATYTLTAGSLLGNGVGLTFTNYGIPGGTNQRIFVLENGTNGNDADIVIGDGHVYALEIWAPASAPTTLNWWRTGATTDDCDLTGQGFMAGGETASRLTIASSGRAGGAPRNYLLALYGETTTDPISISTYPAPGITNYIVDTFPASAYSGGQITNVWTNWYGAAVTYPDGLTWSSSDAAGDASSGSMKITANFGPSADQWTIFNGWNGISPALNGLVVSYLEADIRFEAGSATTVNGTVENYGHLQLGVVTNFSGAYYLPGSVEIQAGNNNWTHIRLPVNASTDTNLLSLANVIFHIYGPWYGSTPLTGQSILYVDNVKFTGPLNPVSGPPTVISYSRAVPGLRFFTPNTGTASVRENIAPSGSPFYGWYDNVNSSFPFAYTMTITNFPPASIQNFEFHMFLIPMDHLRYGPYDNSYADWDATNCVAFRIRGTGSNYMGSFAYKVNAPNSGANTVLGTVTSTHAVGNWVVRFNSETSVTLITPTGTQTNFSMSPTDAAGFLNPVEVYWGAQADAANAQGQAVDLAGVNITGAVVEENFLPDTMLSSLWTKVANNPDCIWMSGPNAKYWVNWSMPDFGFYPIVSTNLTSWTAPTLTNNLIGSRKWALFQAGDVPANATRLFFGVRAAQ